MTATATPSANGTAKSATNNAQAILDAARRLRSERLAFALHVKEEVERELNASASEVADVLHDCYAMVIESAKDVAEAVGILVADFDLAALSVSEDRAAELPALVLPAVETERFPSAWRFAMANGEDGANDEIAKTLDAYEMASAGPVEPVPEPEPMPQPVEHPSEEPTPVDELPPALRVMHCPACVTVHQAVRAGLNCTDCLLLHGKIVPLVEGDPPAKVKSRKKPHKARS